MHEPEHNLLEPRPLVPRTPAEPVARIDCHIHSAYSPDGKGTLKELVAVGKEKGLTGLCVTDHNVLRIATEMKAFGGTFTLVPGVEVSTRVGHCLALGVRETIPRGLALEETLEAITRAGGVGVPSHPFRRTHGVGGSEVLAALPTLKAIEVYNARDGAKRSNKRAGELARAQRIGGTGGSDAHQVFEVGNAYTAFPKAVETADDLIDQIRKRETWGVGEPTPRWMIAKQNAKNLYLFARRGFRGI